MRATRRNYQSGRAMAGLFCRNAVARAGISPSMMANGVTRRGPRVRLLLEVDPSIPADTRRAIVRGDSDARARLVALGLNECEAAELLDERTDDMRC